MEFTVYSDEYYMNQAYKQALLARELDEIPVGAVVVCGRTIVAKAHNQTESLRDATAHAEILAITAASNFLGAKYLSECTLYVTLEPCLMCAGALAWSQLGRLIYAAEDPKKGFTLWHRKTTPILHSKTECVHGLMEEQCRHLIQDFFRNMRN